MGLFLLWVMGCYLSPILTSHLAVYSFVHVCPALIYEVTQILHLLFVGVVHGGVNSTCTYLIRHDIPALEVLLL